ncbi:lactate utilization protein [Clostridium sp. HMP27]|uniref:lactate utilization protein n=1 Tax=Clostridium sp. HMP27 TaxID=1487921 RepID=UPI00052CDFC6|nr:lactate utilization protein [Clostridium sp. HMP27]KGK87924.1 membrane protein [Clostridium sp. HMP27]
MDKFMQWRNEKLIERTIENLKRNNMEAVLVQDEVELIGKLNELIKEGTVVSVGGSETLLETGVIDYLRNGNFTFLDRYDSNLTIQGRKELNKKAFCADTYLCSSNAITENGELFNVDGNGNRVAAMLFGPDQVIVVCGVNKIVKDLKEAEQRVKKIAAPVNAKKLNKNTPCAKVGYCMDCNSDDRICCDYVIMKKQRNDRIKVIILNKDLGF